MLWHNWYQLPNKTYMFFASSTNNHLMHRAREGLPRHEDESYVLKNLTHIPPLYKRHHHSGNRDILENLPHLLE